MERLRQIEQFIRELIKRQELAFLGSVDGEGFPAIRAMLRPRKCDDIHEMWFTTNTPSDKITHYTQNPKACLYVCDPVRFQGALLKGHIQLYDAATEKERLSTLGDVLYYPNGHAEAGYVALKFSAVGGRVYNQRGSEDFRV